MKTITKEFTVYEFDELSGEAKDKAIRDCIDRKINRMEHQHGMPMELPFAMGVLFYEKHKASIIKDIKDNGCLFLKDGELFK